MRSLLVLFLLWSTSPTLLAQSTSQTSQPEPSIQSLLDRIQQMEKRISELEEHERRETAAQTSNPMLPAPVDQQTTQATSSSSQAMHAEHGTSPTGAREAEIHYPSLQIRGFGDVDFQATRNNPPAASLLGNWTCILLRRCHGRSATSAR